MIGHRKRPLPSLKVVLEWKRVGVRRRAFLLFEEMQQSRHGLLRKRPYWRSWGGKRRVVGPRRIFRHQWNRGLSFLKTLRAVAW